MTLQEQVFKEQGLGTAGQIAKSHHSYCNVESYTAGDHIAIGEFAQSVANNDNEAKSTAGKQVTGNILGVVVRDSLKSVESAEPSSVINAGEPLQIVNIGSVFIETNEPASVGDYVTIDKTNGRVFFSPVRASGRSTIDTGWRVFVGNDYAERGIVGITTSKSKGVNVAKAPYSAGDLVMKDLSVIKAADVTAEDADNALGVLVFTEGKTALITNLEYDANIVFSANNNNWNNNRVAKLPEAHAATNAGGNAIGWWEDYIYSYRAAAASAYTDDLDDETKYPAFHKAIAKGEGWYIPAAYAMAQVINNATAINETLAIFNKQALSGTFWTATPINEVGLLYSNITMAVGSTINADALNKLRENDLSGVGAYAQRISGQNVLAVKAVNLK